MCPIYINKTEIEPCLVDQQCDFVEEARCDQTVLCAKNIQGRRNLGSKSGKV